MKKLIALLTAAVATLTSAWAAEPLAVWNGFTNLTGAEGYTLTAGEGVVDADGVATIADGQILRLDKNLGTAFTVVMEVEDIPGTSSGFTTLLDWRYADNSSHLSVDTKDSRLRHIWNNVDNLSWGQSALFKTPIGRSVIAIAYSYANRGEKTYVNGVEVVSGGAYSQNAVTRLGIGGYVNDTPTQCAVGMKVYRLALYNGQLSAEEVAEVSKVEPAYGKTYTWSNLASKANKTWYYTRASGAFSVNIPATADVPAGTVVAISKLKFGTKASGNNWSSSMTINGVTSSSVSTEDNEYDETYNKLKVYTFDTPALVEVGKAYAVTTAGSSSQFTAVMCASPIDINIGNSGCTYCAVEGAVLHEASVGDEKYNTVAAAIAAAGETETTITLMSDGVGAIEIPANITIDTNRKTLSGAITGSGKIKFAEMPTDAVADACAFTATAWTGTVEVGPIVENGGSAHEFKLQKLGNAGSTILWNGDSGTRGKFLTGGTNNKIAAKVVLAGDLLFNNGSSGANYFFGEIDGNNTANNISFLTWRQNDGVGASYHVDKLSHFKGTITATRYTTISELALDEMPAADEKILSFGEPNGVYHTSADTFAITKITVGGEPVSLAFEIVQDEGIYIRKAASVGETDYATLNEAFENAGANGTIKLLCDIATSVTIPAGKHIDLNGHAIRGNITFGTGSYLIENGEPKINGEATSFDVTFDGSSAFKFKEESAAVLQYDTTATFTPEGDGVYLKHHPYINNIPSTWFTNTKELTLAVVGTMSKDNRTTFIHMGSSNYSNTGLLIGTGDKKDEVVVAWNRGSTVTELTRMNVTDAASSRHSYVVTKHDDDATSTTTFTVYLDGLKWKTIDVDLFTIVGGVQVGSDFGGDIHRLADTNPNKYFDVGGSDTGVINLMRLYDRVITTDEIDAYVAAYPYNSKNGSSKRTFDGAGNWVAASSWSNMAAGEADPTLEETPLAGDVTATITVPAEITVNLDAEETCEKLTLQGSAVSFVSGGDGAIVPSAATIGVPVTLTPAALDLSKANVVIVGDGKIIADYSGYDVKSIYSETTVFVTGEIDQQAEGIVTATLPTHTYRTIGALTYNTTTHQYGFTVTPVMVDVTIPSIEHTTVSVAAGTLNCTITEGVASVPGGADITVTYAPVAGYHFTAETPVASVTASDVTAETQIDVAGVTAVEINKYTVQVMHVENATTYVSIGDGEFEVVAEASIQVEHGKSYSAKYVANEGYMLVLPEGDTEPFKTEGYNYGSVTANMSDYPVHCAAVKIAAKIGETPYATVQDAIDAVQEGDEIVLVDETADIPEGYIVKDGKVVAKPSIPSVSVEKQTTTEADLEAEFIYTMGDVVEEYNDWEANFEVSFGAALKKGDVVLKGNYGTWGWVALETMPETLAAGDVWTLLPSSGAGSVNFGEVVSIGTFKCGVINMKAAKGTTMTVKLVLKKEGEEALVLDTQEYELGEPQATDLPGAEEVTAADKDAYNEWAAENGVTESTTTDTKVLATAFAMGVTVPAGSTIEAAAQQAVEDEVPSIDMAELVAGNLEDAVKAINEKYNGKVEASLVEVTEGTLKSTDTAKFYKLSITIKK